LLPGIQQVRESARRVQCTNNLRQIGLATFQFLDARQAFPPARLTPTFDATDQDCVGAASWLVYLLPHLEQNQLYEQWDFSVSYEDQVETAVSTPLPIFLCSSRHSMSNANAPDRVVTDRSGGGG